MAETIWPPDEEPLYAEADRNFCVNKDLLQRLQDVSGGIDLRIDGISVRTGYFYYLHMKLYRRAGPPRARDRVAALTVLKRGFSALFQPTGLPTAQGGKLRLDHPVDLYVGSGGVWNKNIGIKGPSVVLAIPAVPSFLPPDTPQLGQALSLVPLFLPRTYRWGVLIYKALQAANLPVSRQRFWKNHLLYLMRLRGFSRQFSDLFARNTFSSVHFCRFADVNMQGMLLAARRHGVEAIEYQHGVLSAFHPAVALMARDVPGTVPDVLVVADPIYQGIDYGPASVEMMRDGGGAPAISNTTERSRGILLSMQPRFSDEALDLAVRLATDYPDTRFTLRAHPRAGVAPERLPALQDHPNLAYERAEDIESTLSLADCAGLITGSSTMGLSAALRGIPSLFVHQEGYEQAWNLLMNERQLISIGGTYSAIRSWVEGCRRQ